MFEAGMRVYMKSVQMKENRLTQRQLRLLLSVGKSRR